MAGKLLVKASFGQYSSIAHLLWSGAATCHLKLERLDKVQKRALSVIGEGTIIDSLALRRTASALCLLYKLLSGPRLTTLQPLLPAQLTPVDNPRACLDTSSPRAILFGSPLTCQCDQTQRLLGHSPMGMSGPGTHFRRQCWRMLYSQRSPGFKIKADKHLIRTNWVCARNVT